MNVQAQNALLKILEEPPSYMVFILTAKSRTAFLPTVQSRCVCVSVLGVTEHEALPVLRDKLPDLSERDLIDRIRLFSGCIGAVIDSASEDGFGKTIEQIKAVSAAVLAPQELVLMKATAPLEKDKSLTDAVLSGVRLVLRDAITLAAGGTATISVAPDTAKTLATALTDRQLLACTAVITELMDARSRNMNQALLITLLCARLRAAAGR